MPFLSNKIQEAIALAIKVHWTDDKQLRKGDGSPFITHPLIIALILAKCGADDDTIIAGILHDTIEDRSNDDISLDKISHQFGKTVTTIVSDLTEPEKETNNWEERKNYNLNKINQLNYKSLLVKSADILHNLTGDIQRCKNSGKEACFSNFNAPMEKQRVKYIQQIEALQKAWPENPLLPELTGCLNVIKETWK